MPLEILFFGGTSIDFLQAKSEDKFSACIGGSITNSAIISAKLGLKTALICKVGKDPLGNCAVKYLMRSGINTKGSAYMSQNRQYIKIPAFKTRIADTIGAGDAYTAGLLYQLSKAGERLFWNNIKENMYFASALSAIICTKKGSNQALNSIQQVEKFLSKHL